MWLVNEFGLLEVGCSRYNLSLQNDPALGKFLLIEAVLGEVQIGSSAGKCSNCAKFQFSLKFPFFFAFANLVGRFIGNILTRGHFLKNSTSTTATSTP